MKKKVYRYLFCTAGFCGHAAVLSDTVLDVMRRSVYAALGDGFVGLANSRAVFTNEAFRLAAKNTGRFLLTCIPILLVLSLLVALGIRELCRLTSAEESVSDSVCDPVSDNGSAVAAFAGTQGRVKWNAGGYYRACGLDERQSRLRHLGLLLYLEKSGVSCGALAGRTARCAKGNLRGGVNGWGRQARNTAAHSPALSKTCHLYDHGHCDRQFL